MQKAETRSGWVAQMPLIILTCSRRGDAGRGRTATSWGCYLLKTTGPLKRENSECHHIQDKIAKGNDVKTDV